MTDSINQIDAEQFACSCEYNAAVERVKAEQAEVEAPTLSAYYGPVKLLTRYDGPNFVVPAVQSINFFRHAHVGFFNNEIPTYYIDKGSSVKVKFYINGPTLFYEVTVTGPEVLS